MTSPGQLFSARIAIAISPASSGMAFELAPVKIWPLLPVLILVLIVPNAATPQVSQASRECSPLSLPVGIEPDVISKAAEFLIAAETVQVHPYWPGGKSGVTIGIGWDLGYHNASELRSTWEELGDSTVRRLDIAAGRKGPAAQTLISQLRSINVPADVSKQVLANALRTYYYPFVTSHFPGITRLPAEVQVVLISLVFNRGVSMGHEPDWSFAKEVDSRWEFRELHRDVQAGDLFAMYAHLGTMKRL